MGGSWQAACEKELGNDVQDNNFGDRRLRFEMMASSKSKITSFKDLG